MAGPFWFAWVDEGTAFDPDLHAVEGEDVFSFEISHQEGDFATLTLDVVNPRIGLLNEGREQWGWLSHGDGSGVEPLFYGRLVGIPKDLQNEIVRLEFRAKPIDYEDQKEALAATLRVAPFWDAVWLAEEARTDPDTVLESRTQLWHIDRLTHEVTVSDIIQGEDGTIVVGGDYFYDSLALTYTGPPGKVCTIKAEASWKQKTTGQVDITSQFPPYISTYTGEGLTDDWPKTDDNIGRGWKFVTASWRPYGSTMTYGSPSTFSSQTSNILYLYAARIVPENMVVAYDAEREYVETMELTVQANVQPLFSEASDDETITLDVAAQVDEPVDPPETSRGELQMPIGDLKSRRYFQTQRGLQSVDYLICLARAQLLYRARAVEVNFEMPFEAGATLSCRQMAQIEDNRLPGGTAVGKVKGYSLSMDGSTGAAVCRVTIGCTVGTGGLAIAEVGTPSYTEEGVLDAGIQTYDGNTRDVVLGEVTVSDFSGVAINDDGVDWDLVTPASVVEAVEVINDSTEQLATINEVRSEEDIWDIPQILREAYTQVRLDLISSRGGPFETTFQVGTSSLEIPQQIDLRASAA